ncbi:MAG TPA: hypothetical protein VE078_00415 [Thermoanaerobaculia bacterium]|nr:hypothetical protein [Thermoanaerobaculia bacterium]
MKVRSIALGLAVLLCAVPLLAQDNFIEDGDDVWNTPGGGGTRTVILGSQFQALCGVSGAPDTSVTFKGHNIPGQGTGDTVVTRLDDADVSQLNVPVTVDIQLKKLSFRSTSTHPCSPNTLWVSESGTQSIGSMTITRTSPNGGTFSASVPVSVQIVAKNSSGGTVGSTVRASGSFNDSSSSPFSFTPPSGGASGSQWYPSVDPVTLQAQGTCRFGNETAPSTHCYEPATTCPGPIVIGNNSMKGVGAKAIAQPEPCSIEAEPKQVDSH